MVFVSESLRDIFVIYLMSSQAKISVEIFTFTTHKQWTRVHKLDFTWQSLCCHCVRGVIYAVLKIRSMLIFSIQDTRVFISFVGMDCEALSECDRFVCRIDWRNIIQAESQFFDRLILFAVCCTHEENRRIVFLIYSSLVNGWTGKRWQNKINMSVITR